MWNFTNLFRNYSAELQRFLRRRGAAQDVAADLSQETFLRLMTAARKNKFATLPDNHKAYLFRVAANLQTDHARSQKLNPLAGHTAALSETFADPAPLADEILISAEFMRILEQALSEVPDIPRRVYLMRLDGKTFADIARELHLPLQTAYSQMNRVMIHLQYRISQAENGLTGKRA